MAGVSYGVVHMLGVYMAYLLCKKVSCEHLSLCR